MRRTFILLGILIAMLTFGCKTKSNHKLIIFHAGSLSVPFKQMKDEFVELHPDVEILLESAGSVNCIRKISDLKRECDIMASADYTLIDELLIPEYANWNIKFASNEMAIIYHNSSKYANEINDKNWYEILLRDDVALGRSDPNSDPCGYRAILTTQLAERFYGLGGFTKEIIAKDRKYIRPKEVDLLALLESNTIDYMFLYRSVAEQHGLNYIILPDSINLKNPSLKQHYLNAQTNIAGKEPGKYMTKNGQPIVYGISILNDAPNKAIALEFVEFVLSKQGGQKIMEDNGQPVFIDFEDKYLDLIPGKLANHLTN